MRLSPMHQRNKPIYLVSLFSFLSLSCTSRTNNETKSEAKETKSSGLLPSGAGLGEAGEQLEVDEAESIQQLVDLGLVIQKGTRRNEGKPGDRLKRDVHTKSHGCARGVFEVDPQLPAELQTGVFQAGVRYPVWSRFSNGVPGTGSDSAPSSRGFAFKLMEVEKQLASFNKTLPPDESAWLLDGRQSFGQDFTFLNHRQFIIKDLKTYVTFTKGVADGNPIPAFISTDPKNPYLKPGQAKTFAETVLQPVSNPVEISYFGQVPFKYKTTAAKWRLDRCEKVDKREERPGQKPPNSLYRALASTLENGDICYDFSIILQKDAKVQPLEDSHIEWLSDDGDIKAGRNFANRTRIARLVLPRQPLPDPANNAHCETMSFNPWYALAAHKPLGNMGRARKAIYITGAFNRTAVTKGDAPDDQHERMLAMPSLFANSAR